MKFSQIDSIGNEEPERVFWPDSAPNKDHPEAVFLHIRPLNNRDHSVRQSDLQLAYMEEHGAQAEGEELFELNRRAQAETVLVRMEGFEDVEDTPETRAQLFERCWPAQRFVIAHASRIASRRAHVAQDAEGNSETSPAELFSGAEKKSESESA